MPTAYYIEWSSTIIKIKRLHQSLMNKDAALLLLKKNRRFNAVGIIKDAALLLLVEDQLINTAALLL